MTTSGSWPQAGTIVMLHYAGPPHVGGVEATIAAHARCLAGTGHRVRILAGKAGKQGSGIETAIVPEIASRGDEIEFINAELATGRVSEHFESLVDRITRRLSPFLTGASVLIVHNALTLHK